MFSSRFFWTAAVGYLALAAVAAWGFGRLVDPGSADSAGSSHAAGTLIWEAVLTVAALGLFLTWGVLHRAAVRLAGITESAAARQLGESLWSAPATARGSARNLESAIDSM